MGRYILTFVRELPGPCSAVGCMSNLSFRVASSNPSLASYYYVPNFEKVWCCILLLARPSMRLSHFLKYAISYEPWMLGF